MLMCGTMEGFINTCWFKRQESAGEEVDWTLSPFSCLKGILQKSDVPAPSLLAWYVENKKARNIQCRYSILTFIWSASSSFLAELCAVCLSSTHLEVQLQPPSQRKHKLLQSVVEQSECVEDPDIWVHTGASLLSCLVCFGKSSSINSSFCIVKYAQQCRFHRLIVLNERAYIQYT